MVVMVLQIPCLVTVFPNKSLRRRRVGFPPAPSQGDAGARGGERAGSSGLLRQRTWGRSCGGAEPCWAHQASPGPWPQVAAEPPNPNTPTALLASVRWCFAPESQGPKVIPAANSGTEAKAHTKSENKPSRGCTDFSPALASSGHRCTSPPCPGPSGSAPSWVQVAPCPQESGSARHQHGPERSRDPRPVCLHL